MTNQKKPDWKAVGSLYGGYAAPVIVGAILGGLPGAWLGALFGGAFVVSEVAQGKLDSQDPDKK